MRRTFVAVVLLCLLCVPAPATAAPPADPQIVAVYPNPVAHGDAGEFVVVDVPPGTTLSRYALTDGETTVDLPAFEGTRRVVLSTAANRTARLVDRPVRQLPGRLELANAGERVRLVRTNETADGVAYEPADAVAYEPADAVAYERAPEGEVLWLDGEAGGCPAGRSRCWRPLGATDLPVATAGTGTVEAFVLPDAAGVPADELTAANDRIQLAGYSLTSERVAAALRRAHRRNVTVQVLVEGGPVGGIDERQATLLDGLVAAGIDVRVVGGDRARYRYHHAKYAVVDDRAIVTTENWKPSGTGGRASRGWGVVTNESRIVAGLASTFRADAGWQDAVPWETYRQSVNATAADPATGSFGRQFRVRTVPVDRTALLVAPDNAEGEVVDLLRGAEESIWIEQAGVGGVGQPFVRESVAAARRGVRVRLLLGNAWYNREENQAVADRLNAVADREGLDLEARLVEPDGRFDRLHAKGAVVDGERVLLGSLNWNNNSARENREVALVLSGEEVGDYYETVVRADWRGGRLRVLIGLLLVALLGLVAAARIARRIRFAPIAR